MKRKIIKIDESLCNGCGNCVPACHEGALQIIDGKARLISDLFCDGLGACIGECPEGAMEIVEREAELYDEYKVMDYIVRGGSNVIKAHLQHLADHGEREYLSQATKYLKERNIIIPEIRAAGGERNGCPGSASKEIPVSTVDAGEKDDYRPSMLTHWPVQLHLISPGVSFFRNSDLLVAADCTSFACASFHEKLLAGRKVVVACPKLDTNQQSYLDKLITLFSNSGIRSVTIAIMEVPCCGGLFPDFRPKTA